MLFLAPMQGLTELLFRKVYSICYPDAFDFAVSPFLSLTHGNLKDADKKIEDVMPGPNVGLMPVIPQILGHETDEFIDLANRLNDLGYNEVNWNMGCPMRRVAGKHRGSGILPYPDEVNAILSEVVPNIRCSLSVKIRLGYRNNDEIDKIIPILNSFPIKNVTIHPRIGKQMYSGVPDIEKFAEVLPKIKHPVSYNGDIFTVGDYVRIRTRFPQVKDVMIGRGALYNPLLPVMIRQRCPDDFSNGDRFVNASYTSAKMFITRLVDEIMVQNISDQAKTRKIKEYWCLLSKSISGTEESKRRVLHADNLEEMRRLITEMTK
ncbi:MAG: tRNA-dihydrouridine synthase family protein [Bacteroidales bacterium]|nr:tRNA-dihydrouridine synthase family protein [Bacteroidales bacterium]